MSIAVLVSNLVPGKGAKIAASSVCIRIGAVRAKKSQHAKPGCGTPGSLDKICEFERETVPQVGAEASKKPNYWDEENPAH